MKVLALVILVVSSCTGLGSGPYLPSGWRPKGPAFLLPTEVEKSTAAVPLKDVPLQETETSGSSFLREYGPPKVQVEETTLAVEQESSGSDALREYGLSKAEQVSEVSQDLTLQSLPEPITEQAFVVIETKFSEEEKSAGVQEAADEQNKSNNEEQTSTQAAVNNDDAESVITQTESSGSLAITEETTGKIEELVQGINEEVVQGKSEELVQEKSEEVNQGKGDEVVQGKSEQVVERKSEEVVQGKSEEVDQKKSEEVEAKSEYVSQQEENANVVASVEQNKQEIAEGNVVEDGVKNIAEALVNLENEIKAQQVETEVSVVRTSQESSGSLQKGPVGFLEYGPPGFTEYGPPKGDLARAVAYDASDSSLETNETRKRRFSPKFKKPTTKV